MIFSIDGLVHRVMSAVMAMTLMCGLAHAGEDRCLPGATLSAYVAQKREAGKDEGTILKEPESEGRIDSQGDGGIFEASIVVWVFQHEVGSRDAYDKFYAECRKETR
jgi:hypothetical protein